MNSVARKIVHIAFGAGALLLKWLPTGAAAAMAAGAFAFNLFLLRYVGGRRIARTERGYDRGILLYPLAVLGLILAFPRQPAIAGTVWIILAVGDGFATLVGQQVMGSRIPWNADKSWIGTTAFVVSALPAALAVAIFLELETELLPVAAVVASTVLVCAVAETLPLTVDDNLTVPFIGALVMLALVHVARLPEIGISSLEEWWLAANAGLAMLGYALRTVTASGMVGGFILGAILILFAGWQLYVVLLVFFAIGTLATKIGYRRKATMDIAQERGGRRGFSHAFANVGVAAILSICIAAANDPALLWLAAIASLATATADTTGSEIGPLLGRRTFLPLTFRRVSPGTEGAISLEGTLAGAVTAFIVSLIGVLLMPGQHVWKAVAVSTAAAVLGSYLESITGSWNRKRPFQVPNAALNFFNTLAGALLVLIWGAFRQ